MNEMHQLPFPELFKHLSEQCDDVIFAFSPLEKRFLHLNDSFEKIYRRPKQLVTANPELLLAWTHKDDRNLLTENLQRLFTVKKIEKLDFRMLWPDESERWIRITAMVADVAPQSIIIGLASDFTLKKTYIEKLEKFARKKNSILEILSHDLAGYLNNIKNASRIIQLEMGMSASAGIMRLLDVITRNSTNSMNLISDFVKQEFIESVEVNLYKQRDDLLVAIGQIIDQYKNSEEAIRKNFQLVCSSETLMASVDQSKFCQVINNLISNAIKFTPDGGLITTTLIEQEKTVLVIIEDNGIGIPAALQPILFDRFTAASRKGLKGEPTIGLGMSIVRQIIDWHGGRIWFESEEGKGSKFYIEIPK